MSHVQRRVIKLGGTSVGSPERLATSLGIVEAGARKGGVVVVTSALAGVTDALLPAMAGAGAGRLAASAFVDSLRGRHLALLGAVATSAEASRAEPTLEARLGELENGLRAVASKRAVSPADRDSLVASGERLAAPILAAGLRSRGLDARAVDAGSLVRTDRTFGDAVVDFETTRELVESSLRGLPAEVVPVVTGFLGATRDGDTTTLGRDGSDYSAAILGWALDADCVEIWSDVDGVMSADPRVVPTAVLLPRLSWREAATLAERGARVLHPRTIAPLEEAGIPAIIANALRPEAPGTRVAGEPGLSRSTAVTSRSRSTEAEVVVLGRLGAGGPSGPGGPCPPSGCPRERSRLRRARLRSALW